MDNARRSFLRGYFSKPPQIHPPRPPWAGDNDALFIEKCTRCAECITSCPTSVLKIGDGGFPEVSFQLNGCDLCGKCAHVCQPKALIQAPSMPAWQWIAEISTACLALQQVECRVCGEFCDQHAIRFKPQLGGVPSPQVQSVNCTGCGHCVSKCPTQAIQMKTPKTA